MARALVGTSGWTYASWRGAFYPEDLPSRLITHSKRLLEVEEAWHNFVDNARGLALHLGPILLQFPASFPRDSVRLARFLDMAQGGGSTPPPLRLIFEFRHDSWFTDESYRLLKTHGAGLCIADSPGYPRKDMLTADFTYFRFHGRSQLFRSEYSEAEIAEEAQKMKRYLRDGVDVYAYFNNDARGCAIKNARSLKARLEE